MRKKKATHPERILCKKFGITLLITLLVMVIYGCTKPLSPGVQKICDSTLENIGGYDRGNVLQCREFYKKMPQENLADAPEIIFNKEGEVIAYCGGMPGPLPTSPDPRCSISCEKHLVC